MPSFWRHVKKVLDESQMIIEVLDARLIEETRNSEIELKIKHSGKKILYVVTKCDLVDVKKLRAQMKHLKPSVFISSKDHFGTTLLKKKILELSRGENTVVGVVGYPNVGKSSLINALAGRAKTRTSSESGHTKGMQKIRVDNKIVVLDTPGVYPFKEKDLAKHAKIGSIDYAKIKDPELAALKLIDDEKILIKKHYSLEKDDPEEILEEIGLKYKRIGKGGKVNLENAARFVLKEWQTGKIVNV